MSLDWYRKKTWNESDKEEFFKRLSRARKESRAQYLKIQAIELYYTKEYELLRVAEELLNKMLEEFPDDNFNRSGALNTLGDIHKELSNEEKALDFYEKALDFEKVYPNVKTQAYLNFAELIIKLKDNSKYIKAEEILMTKISGLLFPIEKYKVFSIISVLNKYKGLDEQAKYYAELAEENANQETSGLRYHKHLGIVKERETWLDKLVKKR